MLMNLDRRPSTSARRRSSYLTRAGALFAACAVLALVGCSSSTTSTSASAPATSQASQPTTALTADQFAKLISQPTVAGLTIATAFTPRSTTGTVSATCQAYDTANIAATHVTGDAKRGETSFRVAISLLKSMTTDFSKAFVTACFNPTGDVASTPGVTGSTKWVLYTASDKSTMLLAEYRGVGLILFPNAAGVSLKAEDYTKDFAASVDAAAR